MVSTYRGQITYMRQYTSPQLVKKTACGLLGAKPLSEHMMAYW